MSGHYPAAANYSEPYKIAVLVIYVYMIPFQDDPEDLHFKKGDIMIVLRKDEDEWWTVRHSDGRMGSIPVPYIEVVSYVFVVIVIQQSIKMYVFTTNM